MTNNSDFLDCSDKLPAGKFRNLIYLKAMKALVEPGESVGLLAAQVFHRVENLLSLY